VVKVAEAQPGLLLLQGAVWEDLDSLREQLAVRLGTGTALREAGGMRLASLVTSFEPGWAEGGSI
jgi:hypothetical protein